MKWCHPSTLDCLYHAYMDKYYLVVLFGGRSAEHDVSCVSARHVLTAADPDRYEIIPVGIDKEGKWSLSSSSLESLKSGDFSDGLNPSGIDWDPLPELMKFLSKSLMNVSDSICSWLLFFTIPKICSKFV